MSIPSPERRIIVLSAIAVVLVFLGLNIHYSGNRLVLPLDDSYIYARYAVSTAQGHPFRYTPGAAPSVGTTGLLYPYILAPFYWLGFHGHGLIWVMFLLNAALFVFSALLVFRLAAAGSDRSTGRLATALFLLSGPLAWGYLSGMEIGLLVTVWLALTLQLQKRKEKHALLLASLLSLIRPLGWLWCLVLWLALPYRPGANRKKTRLKWLIPLAAGSLNIIVNLLVSGQMAPSSSHPKSPLHLPGLHLPTILQHVAGFFQILFKHLFSGISGPDLQGNLNQLDPMAHVAPLALIFLAFGLIMAFWGKKEDGIVGNGLDFWTALWFLIGIFWIALTTGSTAHYFRHILPVWPAVILLTVSGIRSLSRGIKIPRLSTEGLFKGLAAYFILFGVISTAHFALLYGQSAHGFSRQYVDTAFWIDRNLDPRSRIASLDAGILGYYSHREFFDLFGLTTPSMGSVTHFYADDEGTKYEVMENLPPSLRPTHFVLHARRFDHADWNPYQPLMARDEGNRPIILHSARVLIPVPLIGQNLQVWEADWALAHSGNQPGETGGRKVVDRIDIADPRSETGHQVRISSATPGFLGSNLFRRLKGPRDDPVMDGGRGISGSLQMTLEGIEAGKDLFLKIRTLPAPNAIRLHVQADENSLGIWTLPSPRPDCWLEPAFRIPAGQIRASRLQITLTGLFMPFHIWALQ